ncbi:nucleoside deaminase [Candidatus Omnitrophota bacterium]
MLAAKEADRQFMQMAIDKAREGIAQGQTPFGACIVKDGEVISCEHNVVWATKDITAHGEVHALRVACQKLNDINLEGCVIYSTCEPCPMCFSACHWAQITKIVYGAGIEDAQKAGFNELAISNVDLKEKGGSSVEIVAHFMREENVALFEEWVARTDKRLY